MVEPQSGWASSTIGVSSPVTPAWSVQLNDDVTGSRGSNDEQEVVQAHNGIVLLAASHFLRQPESTTMPVSATRIVKSVSLRNFRTLTDVH